MFAPERLKYVRTQRGLTQKQLAEKCGMHDSAIRRYESGRQNPKRETIERFADALNIESSLFESSIYSDGEFYQRNIDEMSKEAKRLVDCLKSCVVYKNEDDNFVGEPIIISDSDFKDKNYLLELFKRLNMKGKEEAINYVSYLTEQEKYTAPDSSTASDHEEGEP